MPGMVGIMAEPQAAPAPVTRIKVPPKYEAIMRWLFANPEKSIQEGARVFNVSPGWFSTVVNSDLFIARYQEFLAEMDEAQELPRMAHRVLGATAFAIEKLVSQIENSTDPDFIAKATDILLRASKPPASTTINHNNGPVQQNTFQLDPRLAAISDARKAALEAARGHALPVIDVESIAVPGPNGGAMLDRLEVKPPQERVELTIMAEADILKAFDE